MPLIARWILARTRRSPLPHGQVASTERQRREDDSSRKGLRSPETAFRKQREPLLALVLSSIRERREGRQTPPGVLPYVPPQSVVPFRIFACFHHQGALASSPHSTQFSSSSSSSSYSALQFIPRSTCQRPCNDPSNPPTHAPPGPCDHRQRIKGTSRLSSPPRP